MFDCQKCGACCSFFRVSLHWLEAEDKKIPQQILEKKDSHLYCLKGTSQKNPKCQALCGKVGEEVACSIYNKRPDVCREVLAGSEQCIKARTHWKL